MLAESADDLFEQAVSQHEAGKLAEAEALYRQILAAQPNDADVLQLLGMLNSQQGRKEEAVAFLRRALALAPAAPDCNYNMGVVLAELSRHDEAIAALKRATELKPDFAEAFQHLGISLRAQNQLEPAAEAFSKAAVLRPDFAEALNNLGTVLRLQNKFEEAIAAYRKALGLRPLAGEIHKNLGNALAASGDADGAIEAYRQSVNLRPDDVATAFMLGNTLLTSGRAAEAARTIRAALVLQPNSPEMMNNLANALFVQGEFTAAAEVFSQIIALKPEFAVAHNNLGNVKKELGQVEAAMDCFRQSLMLERNPGFHSNLLFTMHLLEPSDPATVFQEHVSWDRIYGNHPEAKTAAHDNDRDPDRRLRIGYVSTDLRDHPVAFFIENLISNHDPKQVEVFVYYAGPRPDAVTQRFMRLVPNWRNIASYDDARAADAIRQDRIDILVDLSGHTAGSRLMIFTRKPAPIQINYLGYPDTSGLAAMDYRLTDGYADPVGKTERFHSEHLIRLPKTFAIYRPPDAAPPVGPLPAANRGFVTFGSFSTASKIGDSVLRAWTEILHRVADSRLLIMAKGITDPTLQRRLRKPFDDRGIARDRLRFVARRPFVDYLALHREVDILLDTFPVNGHTVTCHAIWMGVPPVTLAGETHIQRLGASVLNNLDLPELIASSPQEYVEIAVRLAGDLPRLDRLRSGMRERFSASPLARGREFAAEFESACRQAWRQWIQK
jgi:predicted O-linked N-acetylglucosamine transferase (SPINDLY family)